VPEQITLQQYTFSNQPEKTAARGFDAFGDDTQAPALGTDERIAVMMASTGNPMLNFTLDENRRSIFRLLTEILSIAG